MNYKKIQLIKEIDLKIFYKVYFEYKTIGKRTCFNTYLECLFYVLDKDKLTNKKKLEKQSRN